MPSTLAKKNVARQIARTALVVLLGACTSGPPAPPAPSADIPAPEPPFSAPPPITQEPLQSLSWDSLPGWREDDPRPALAAFLESCGVLRRDPAWLAACDRANQFASTTEEAVREYFEQHFTAHQVRDASGDEVGLITGYYEPLLHGSRTRTPRFRYPVYGVPADLVAIDPGEAPSAQRQRGRVDGARLVPYYRRAEIERGAGQLRGREIVWVDDAVDLFFLHIQGSGRVRLPDGEMVRLAYADHNGHPYRSIGKRLAERGELALEQASMQRIKAWVRDNPSRLRELLDYNDRYVFFRELPGEAPGPLGAMNVPLTPGRSLAIDPAAVPLGAPVFLSTTWPSTSAPLNRLMVAQDTGSAIKGAVRADFFWGFGDEAGEFAGRMKQSARLWVLVPNGYSLEALLANAGRKGS